MAVGIAGGTYDHQSEQPIGVLGGGGTVSSGLGKKSRKKKKIFKPIRSLVTMTRPPSLNHIQQLIPFTLYMIKIILYNLIIKLFLT